MLVENQTGNFQITNFGIENSGFAEDIKTFNGIDVLHNLTEDVVGGKTQRIVNIDNKSLGFTKFLKFGYFEAGVEEFGFGQR